MVTFLTYKPHYCNLRYGQSVSDKIFYMKTFGISRKIPVFSNLVLSYLNSMLLPKDSIYLCEGPAELYPFLKGKPKNSKIITFMKESTLYDIDTGSIGKWKKEFLLRLFSLSDVYITDTQYYANLIRKYLDKPVFVHPPFCAQEFFDIKNDLNAKKLLFIAEKDKKKGLVELIQAFKILRSEDASWELFVVGRISSLVKEHVDGLHVEGYVENMQPYMKKCSIYVHPTKFDVFGVSVLEAMSAGLLPIVSSGTGISEYLKSSGLSEFVSKSNDPKEIAMKIKTVFNLSDKRKVELSRKCRSFAQNFRERKNVLQFKKIFREAENL